MPARRTAAPSVLAALATVGLAARADAQSAAPRTLPSASATPPVFVPVFVPAPVATPTPAPTSAPAPAATQTIRPPQSEAEREEERYWETRAHAMQVALHVVADEEERERTSTLAITLGLGAGAAAGGVLGALQGDFASVLTGALLAGVGGAMLFAAPVRYAMAGGAGYAPLREYERLARANTPPRALEGAMVRHWNEQIDREFATRALTGIAYGGAGLLSAGLGIYFGANASRSSTGVSASFAPLITGLTAGGAGAVALAVWFFATSGPSERALAHWRRYGTPAARDLSGATVRPTALLTPEARGLGLVGSF